jgi:hypothetical protein
MDIHRAETYKQLQALNLLDIVVVGRTCDGNASVCVIH